MKLFSVFHGKGMEVKAKGSIEMVVFVWLTISMSSPKTVILTFTTLRMTYLI